MSARDWSPSRARCVLNARITGAFVQDEAKAYRADFASVICLDRVCDDLVDDLFRRVGARESDASDDVPSARLWNDDFADHDGLNVERTHGLRDFALVEFASEAREGVGAIGEVLRRVRATYPECVVDVTRTDMFRQVDDERTGGECDEATFAHVCANAARVGDRFSYHRDVDARGEEFLGGALAEYGRFSSNRDRDKPRFVTIVVYVNPSWAIDDEGETVFVDEDTGVGVTVVPRPGRVVLMDADVFHSLKPPRRRVRYSLVIHTLFTARERGARVELARPEWGAPAALGSAARLQELARAAARVRT